MKSTLFESTVELNDGKPIEVASVEGALRLWDKTKNGLRKASWSASNAVSVVPYTGKIGDASSRLLFMLVRNQIVCIDDLERRGANLSLNDVLGMASFLKEERSCKVVLILNDEELGESKPDFERYLEKVTDVTMIFQPSVQECVAIGLQGTPDKFKPLFTFIEIIGITNIRVIQRISALAAAVAPMMADRDPRVFNMALKTVCILGWMEFMPTDAPNWEFVKGRFLGRAVSMLSKDPDTAERRRWNEILDQLDLGEVTDLDLALQASVRRGYFSEESLSGLIEVAEQRFKNADLDEQLSRAFHLYESTLEPNEEEVVRAFIKAVKDSEKRVQPQTLDAVVVALRGMERNVEASELISSFVKAPIAERQLKRVNLQEIRDTELREALEAHMPLVRDERPLSEILRQSIFGLRGATLQRLGQTSPDEFKDALKTVKGAVHEILSVLLQQDMMAWNGKRIQENVLEALRELAKEQKIYKARLARYIDGAPFWERKKGVGGGDPNA